MSSLPPLPPAFARFPFVTPKSSLAEIDAAWRERCDPLFGESTYQGEGLLKRLPAYLTTRNFPYLGKDLTLRVFINTEVARDWYDKDDSSELLAFTRHGARFIEPGDTVFDCGAHHGIYAMIFADAVGPSGRVIAFEPVPINAQLARLNCDINGFANIDIYPLGLGSKDETIVAAMAAHSTSPAANKTSADSVKMEITTLDRFLPWKPNFVKIDIEGAEVDALMGARALIATKPKILLSVHPPFITGFGRKAADIFEFLKRSDYDCLILYPGKPIQPYDGSFALDTFCELLFLPRK